jgi:outer membrane protein
VPICKAKKILLVLALCATPFAQAQSLSELFNIAREFDATYLGAKALANSAQYKAAQAKSLRLPTVGATVGANWSSSDSPNADAKSTTAIAGLNAKQPLFNAANSRTVSQAQTQLEISKFELQLAEQELMVRTAQTYFDVLAAKDALDTARANKKAISEQLASAKRNFEVGTSTITDTREAQARFDLGLAQEIATENDLRIKRLALDQLVGRVGVEPRPIALPLALPATEPNNVDTWVGQTNTSPNVRRAELGLDIAKLETQKARAGHLPTIDLEGNYQKGHSDSQGTQSRVPFNAAGATTQSNIGVTLRVPLFAGYAIQNRLKETLSLEEQSRNTVDAAKRATAQATRQAFFGVQSLQAQVKALEAAESSTKLALDATQLGYKVGVRVNVDVLNAQTQLFTTQRDLAKARYDILVNSLKLRQAAGQLTAQDIDAVNAMLVK